MAGVDDDRATELTAEIVVAFLSQSTIQPERLPGLVEAIRRALGPARAQGSAAAAELQQVPAAAEIAEVSPTDQPPARVPAVPIEASVTQDYLISLEDGKRYRSLKRHLMAKYGLTPDDYRARWGLPADYPMVASSLAEKRSRAAKLAGLGVRPAKAQTSARPRRATKAPQSS